MWQIPLAMAGAGALLGYMKNEGDEKIEAEDRRLAAETMRYSPWTGMRPGQIRQANLQNAMMQGAMSGGMMGMNMNQMNQGNQLMDAQTNYYNSRAQAPQSVAYSQGNNPWQYMA